jgi:hypothetical protein
MNARQQWLLAQWEAACNGPQLARIRHKVELNAWGKIEFTPPLRRFMGDLDFASRASPSNR